MELLSHLLAFLGSLCFLIASIGLYRMPDAFSRIHAATKASSLGVILLAASAATYFRTLEAIVLAGLIVFLIFLTAPLACHCISSQLLTKSAK